MEDTVRLSMTECFAWAEQRVTVVSVVGEDLPASVHYMVGSAESWDTVVTLCEAKIERKLRKGS